MKKMQWLAIIGLGIFFSFSFNNSDRISKNELLISRGVYAVMPYDFEFDFKYNVLSYDWVFIGRNDAQEGKSQGSLFPEPLVKLIKESKPNDVLMIEHVVVKGDDNSVRTIPGIAVTLK